MRARVGGRFKVRRVCPPPHKHIRVREEIRSFISPWNMTNVPGGSITIARRRGATLADKVTAFARRFALML